VRANATNVLTLRRDASVTDVGTGLLIKCPTQKTELRGSTPGVRTAIEALAAGDVPELELAGLVTAGDGEAALFKLHMLLRRLDLGGWLEHAVLVDGEALVRLRPIGAGGRPQHPAPGPDTPVKLSRFATVQAEDGQLVLRAPDSPFVALLGAGAGALLTALAGWTTPAVLGTAVPALGAVAVNRALALMADARVLTAGGPLEDSERTDPAVAGWATADLWLHARSRGTRLSAGYGGTYAMAGRSSPLPAARPAWSGRRIPLRAPDLDIVAKNDPTLTEVLQRRHSGRRHGAEPINVDQLGELLYRVMHQRRMFTGGDGMELADRPYPSGGAVHELEMYPLITSCSGAEPGLWHYHAADHALDRVAEQSALTDRIVAVAKSSALLPTAPQVVLVVAARFGRVQWKYETIAYALTLKHVGVLYQTVYLVATAMGLEVCGLGGGDATDFAAATGLDYHTEGSVGELVIGSAPDAATGHHDPVAGIQH
jgi:SagB-type dehydrogenase family enzyme